MIRTIYLFLTNAIIWSLLLLSPPTYACSCAPMSEQALLDSTDLAFEGYVKQRVQNLSTGEYHYVFNIELMLKGAAQSNVEVILHSESGASCGREFFPDVKYRIYTFLQNDQLHTGLCNSKLVATGKEAIPIEDEIERLKKRLDDNVIIHSANQRLIDAGCELIHQSPSTGSCFRKNDQNPLVCNGRYLSVFKAIDGSHDQHAIAFEWNRRSDELSVSGPDQIFIEPVECETGMDNTVRFNQSRIRNDDSFSSYFSEEENVVFAQKININGETFTVVTAFNPKSTTNVLYINANGDGLTPQELANQ